MKTSKYFTSDKRLDNLKKEKEREEDDNEENEEEEDDEELDEKKKTNLQNEKSIQQPSSKPLIKKEIKSTIIKRDDKSKLITQTSNQIKSRIIQSQTQNQEINNSKEGISIRRAIQERKAENHPITPASRIIQKTAQGIGKNQFTIKLTQNSSRTQIKTDNLQNLPRPLKTQNSQTQLPIKISGKIENQTQGQTQPYHSRYTRRVVDTNLQNDNNNKEIKVINKNNNYTINVTNNNNSINVTNSNNNDININNEENEDIKDKEEKEEKDEMQTRKIEPKREIKKEPRREFYKESRNEERKIVTNNNYLNNNYNKEKEEKKEIENKEQYNNKNDDKDNNEEEEKEINNNSENKKNVNEIKIKNVLIDRRKEYVTNDTMAKNGVEIVKFSPEETQKVYEKKAEADIIKKKIKDKKKKNNFNRNNNNNATNDYYDNHTHNYHKSNYIFYRRGRDNFSKRNIFERENFYKKAKFDELNNTFDYDDYRDYNNKTFNGIDSYTDIRGKNYISSVFSHRRINNFYERGRPNPIFRGFRGRRGRY